jgi:hypothetical protein
VGVWFEGNRLSQVTTFTVEVVRVFGYFCCFPDYVGTTGMIVGSDLCFVKVDAMLGCCQMFSYHWLLFLQCDVWYPGFSQEYSPFCVKKLVSPSHVGNIGSHES